MSCPHRVVSLVNATIPGNPDQIINAEVSAILGLPPLPEPAVGDGEISAPRMEGNVRRGLATELDVRGEREGTSRSSSGSGPFDLSILCTLVSDANHLLKDTYPVDQRLVDALLWDVKVRRVCWWCFSLSAASSSAVVLVVLVVLAVRRSVRSKSVVGLKGMRHMHFFLNRFFAGSVYFFARTPQTTKFCGVFPQCLCFVELLFYPKPIALVSAEYRRALPNLAYARRVLRQYNLPDKSVGRILMNRNHGTKTSGAVLANERTRWADCAYHRKKTGFHLESSQRGRRVSERPPRATANWRLRPRHRIGAGRQEAASNVSHYLRRASGHVRRHPGSRVSVCAYVHLIVYVCVCLCTFE